MQKSPTSEEASKPIDFAYEKYYKKRDSQCHIYPVEFVVRVFLGTYPLLKLDANDYPGKHILDLGFGDGRNFPLLNNLGFHISGIEISQSIVDLSRQKFDGLGMKTDLRVGRNSSIPFADMAFEYLLACHAIYYVDHHESFADNLAEAARVLKTGGTLVASLPQTNGTIVQNAKLLNNGHVEITDDPLGLRNGSIFRVFNSKQEIIHTFSPYFESFVIGSCQDDYFGIQQNVWTLICKRNDTPIA